MIANYKAPDYTLCKHFEFGCMNEIIYLCRELTNRSGYYAFFHETFHRFALHLLSL